MIEFGKNLEQRKLLNDFILSKQYTVCLKIYVSYICLRFLCYIVYLRTTLRYLFYDHETVSFYLLDEIIKYKQSFSYATEAYQEYRSEI